MTTPDPLSFGGGQFYLLRPERNLWAPKPRAMSNVKSKDIPYGGTVFIKPPGHYKTVWVVQGGVQVVDEANYLIIDGLFDQFSTLITPWGTFTAHLLVFDVALVDSEGVYEGPCTFQWP